MNNEAITVLLTVVTILIILINIGIVKSSWTYVPNTKSKGLRIIEIQTQGETYYHLQHKIPFYRIWKTSYERTGTYSYTWHPIYSTNKKEVEKELENKITKIVNDAYVDDDRIEEIGKRYFDAKSNQSIAMNKFIEKLKLNSNY